MINNPKDFFQQIQNLCEELGLKVKTLTESIASLLSKSDAESTYLKKTDAQSTYLGKTAKAESAKTADTATTATSATKATQDGNGAVISSTYLKSATASSTYLTKSDAQATYLGKDAKAQSATFADTATTATSASTATKAIQDGDGNVISGTYLKSTTAQSTYLSKTDASSTYLGKTAKAASATTADSATTAGSATKATQDANGNVINTTYATVASVNTVAEAAGTAQTAANNAQTTANTANTAAGNRILKSGSRGSLAGYETNGTNTTINQSAPDSNQTGSAITVSNGSANTSWTKIVRVTAAVTVTLGSNWKWQGGSAPTIAAGGVLVCCWCGSGGIASFVSP